MDKLEVFVSTMGMQDGARCLRMQPGAVRLSIINQRDGKGKWAPESCNAAVYHFDERGLSRSRNRALELAKGSLLWMIDDDLILSPDCERSILHAFQEHPHADAIIFNVISETLDRPQKPILKAHKAHIINAMRYPTYRVVFRTESLREAHLRFHEEFGSGAVYSSGEDSLFMADCLRAGLEIWALPVEIAHVRHTDSVWFRGFTDRYLFDKGALFRAIFGKSATAYSAMMLLRHREWQNGKSLFRSLGLMRAGAKDYDARKQSSSR